MLGQPIQLLVGEDTGHKHPVSLAPIRLFFTPTDQFRLLTQAGDELTFFTLGSHIAVFRTRTEALDAASHLALLGHFFQPCVHCGGVSLRVASVLVNNYPEPASHVECCFCGARGPSAGHRNATAERRVAVERWNTRRGIYESVPRAFTPAFLERTDEGWKLTPIDTGDVAAPDSHPNQLRLF